MKTLKKVSIVLLLLLCMPLKQWAQTPYRQYAEEGIVMNFFEIKNIDFRLYLLYNIGMDERFELLAEEDDGQFVVNPGTARINGSFFEAFEAFYNDTYADFSLLSKDDIFERFTVWKEHVSSFHFTSIMMDLIASRVPTINNHCVDSDPFCTSDVITFDAAQTDQTADQLEGATFDDGCIGSSYNPSWYHMRINNPGQFVIHAEGHDPNNNTERDIDYCIWGPFEDPTAPCVAQLTGSKIIDCCYSSSYSEDIYLGYPPEEHEHPTGHQTVNFHMPETGEYYILMITNYSRQPCTISFTKTENSGPGTTDCGILPGIANNDGPYCVGETINLTVTTQAGATYAWTGPNGYTSNIQNPVIPNCTYEMGGTYTCVTTVDGETTSGSTEVIVHPEPVADFSFTSVCEGSATQLTSTATTNPTGHDISSYHWDFGDGQTSDEQNPSHSYASADTYNVTLTITTGDGRCEDAITKEVNVYAIPVATATASPSSVMYGASSTITANVETPGTFTYHWEPANMVTNPNSQTTQTVALTNTQAYTCTITNTQGDCSSTVQVTVAMAGSNLTATATADSYEICENGSTTLHALPVAGTGNYTYNWSPANLLSSTTVQHPVATPPVGSTTFHCTVGDGQTTQEVQVTIVVHPNEESDDYVSICENETYNFYGQTLNTAGVYHHTLQNDFGCDSVVHLHLSLDPLDHFSFDAPEEESCDQYIWDPQGHEIVYTDHEGPYTESGQYHRTYKNQTGCDSLVTVNIDMEYTPHPTEIYPMDPNNTAPHWVITATEFQINSYDFFLWDTNPHCYWDSVTWNFTNPEIDWLLEPFGDRNMRCKLYVLEKVDDTIWLEARAYNRCAPDGIPQRYWFVCSFYGVDEFGPSTGSGANNFDVVPNPNNGQMSLMFNDLSGKTEVKVYDMRGTLVDQFEAINENGPYTYTYDIHDKADGIYFFVATGKHGTTTKKVVIQK